MGAGTAIWRLHGLDPQAERGEGAGPPPTPSTVAAAGTPLSEMGSYPKCARQPSVPRLSPGSRRANRMSAQSVSERRSSAPASAIVPPWTAGQLHSTETRAGDAPSVSRRNSTIRSTTSRRCPEEYSALLEHAVGTERHADLSWPVGSYVCHVADNLRIWAERLAGAAAGAKNVAAYDENVLAEARSYADVPLVAALWSLRRASGDWQAVVGDVPREGVIIIHPERGDMHLEDVARGAAHDAFHHAWDIRRSVEGAI